MNDIVFSVVDVIRNNLAKHGELVTLKLSYVNDNYTIISVVYTEMLMVQAWFICRFQANRVPR